MKTNNEIKKQMPKWKYFIRQFNYWVVRLLDKNYPLIKDNRCDCHFLVHEDPENKSIVVRYNTRRLGKWPDYMIIAGIFHEIGHIKQRFSAYDTETQMIESERDAEIFSIQMLKTYYPQYLKPVIVWTKRKLKDAKWKKENLIHWKALIQIKEYKI